MSKHYPTTAFTADQPKLYFAYGSNLSLHQMKTRCPSSTYSGFGILKGYKWIIGERGYANVAACDGGDDEVEGMLYELGGDGHDEEFLDTAEGVPYAYTKHLLPIHLLSESGTVGKEVKTVQALVYVDEKRKDEGECREEYTTRMNRGIKDALSKGMSTAYVEKVLRKWVKDEPLPPDEEVHDPYWPYNGEQ
ncbi:hypothetical protein B0J14DRAFT_555265 [Halenospora varia]|nr:hypothetical protein B0J14DRAFT_555265 [Halenospora varia]